MYRVFVRACCMIAACSAILIVNSLSASAQDPPPKESSPAPLSTSGIPSDDPIMQALRERAVIAPAKISSPSEAHPRQSRKTSDRWRVAERLMRQARIMEQNADSLEQLGDAEVASTLRQLAATTREQVVQILQVASKPLEKKHDSNPPLKRTTP